MAVPTWNMGLLVPQGGVDQAWLRLVDRGVRRRRRLRTGTCAWQGRSSGSDPSSSTTARWRRRRSHRRASRAGIVDTCVLRIVSRRRWKRSPSGSTASRVPYHERDERGALVGEQPQRVGQRRRVAGRLDRRAPLRRVVPPPAIAPIASSGATAVAPSPLASSRRQGWGSTAITSSPGTAQEQRPSAARARRRRSRRRSPRTPDPASSVTCSAVSTNGRSVAWRGCVTRGRTMTSAASTTKRS